MSQRTSGIHRILSTAWVYDLFQNLVGARKFREKFAREVIMAKADQSLLDIGCGTSVILESLPNLKYVGVDVSPEYIESARLRYDTRGEFHLGSVNALKELEDRRFDIILAIGLLHHLVDDEVLCLLKSARRLLLPGGRLITIDPTFINSQNWIAKRLIMNDRGLNVRTPEEHVAMTEKHFSKADFTVHTDLLRIPYTHVTVVAHA